MTAFYLSAPSQDLLAGMLIKVQGGAPTLAYQNVIGPLQGQAAIPAGTDAQGNPTTAVPAKGDPAMFYVSINLPDATTFPDALPTGVTEDDANGQAVCGVWA